MRYWIIFFLPLLFCHCSDPVSLNEMREGHLLIACIKDGKAGIWDIDQKDWLIQNKYETILNFREGLAAFKQDGKWGFVDTTGKEQIAPVFEDVNDGFFDNYAFVKSNSKWGMIDKMGKFLIQPVYEEVKPVCDGMLAVKKENRWGYCRTDGSLFVAAQFESADNFSNGYGVGNNMINAEDQVACIIDRNGNVNWYDSLFRDIYPFKNNIAIAVTRDHFQVLINTNGAIIYKAPHQQTELARTENPLYVTICSMGNHKQICGLLDNRGKQVLDTVYSTVNGLINGYIVFAVDNKYGIADSSGKVVLAPGFDMIDNFYEGMAVAQNGNKSGYINALGNWVITASYDEAYRFHNGLACVKQGDKYGVIDTKGKWVIPLEYERIGIDNFFGFYVFTEKDNCGLLDANGKSSTGADFDQFINSAGRIVRGTMVPEY